MTRARGKIVRGFAWTMSAEFLKAALHIVLLMVMARLLTPRDYGLFGILLIATGLVEIFANLGMRQAVVQRAQLTDAHIRSSFYVNLVFGLLLFLIFLLLRDPIAAFFKTPDVAPMLAVTGLVFPIRAASLTSQALLFRNLRFKAVSAIDLAGFVIGNFAVGVVLAWRGAGAWSLVAALLAQAAVGSTLQLAVARHAMKPKLELRAVRELLSYGGWMSVAQVAAFFGNKGDNIVVGRFLDAAALGLYTRAFNMAMLPMNFLGSSIDTVLFPAMSGAQGNPEELKAIFKRTVSAVAMLLLPATLTGAIMAKELVAVVLGAKWSAAAAPFAILLAITYFRTSYKIDASVSRALGHARLHAVQNIFYSALVVGFSLVGTRWGLTGVAWGITLAVMLQFIWRRASSVRLLGMNWAEVWREYVPAACLTVPLTATALLVRWTAMHLGWSPLAAVAGVGLAESVVLAVALALLWRFGLAGDLVWLYERARQRLARRAT